MMQNALCPRWYIFPLLLQPLRYNVFIMEITRHFQDFKEIFLLKYKENK